LDILRLVIIAIGAVLLLPGLFGLYFLIDLAQDILMSRAEAATLEARVIIAGLSTLVGFTGVNILLRADIMHPQSGARLAMIACVASSALIVCITLLLLRAFSLSESEIPASPKIAAVLVLGLAVLLAPALFFDYWRKNRRDWQP
jgi:hypothetical protein